LDGNVFKCPFLEELDVLWLSGCLCAHDHYLAGFCLRP
jgi:hypothetical protein